MNHQTTKCANAACDCQIPQSRRYCCESCSMDASNPGAESCACGHDDCASSQQTAGEHSSRLTQYR